MTERALLKHRILAILNHKDNQWMSNFRFGMFLTEVDTTKPVLTWEPLDWDNIPSGALVALHEEVVLALHKHIPL